jgi:sec-independent protein translocase protein TatB
MFDVGFSEILLVGLISLLVIGPQKLPHVARMVGFWLGKAQRMAATVRQEINAELHAEEVRQMLSQKSSLFDDLQTQRLEIAADAQRLQADINAALTLESRIAVPRPLETPPVPAEESIAVTPSVAPLPAWKQAKLKRRRYGKR